MIVIDWPVVNQFLFIYMNYVIFNRDENKHEKNKLENAFKKSLLSFQRGKSGEKFDILQYIYNFENVSACIINWKTCIFCYINNTGDHDSTCNW